MNTRTLTLAIVVTTIIGVAYVVHAGALKNAFTNYDDDTYMYSNYHIKTLSVDNVVWMFTHGYFRSYTPLTLVSHALDFSLWGMDPKGHHLTNLILHLLNSVWVFYLCIIVLEELKRRRGAHELSGGGEATDMGVIVGAAAGALLFAVHPLKVESVGWISDRKDLLCTLFFIPSVIFYIKYARDGGRRVWYAVSLLLFCAAVASKTIAVVAPVVFLVIDVLLLRRPLGAYRKLLLEKSPFFLVSIAAGLAAMASASGSELASVLSEVPIEYRLLYPTYAVFFYIGHLLIPVDLTPIYDLADPATMSVSLGLAVLLAVSFVYALRKGAFWWVLVWSFYVLSISPTFFGMSAGIQPLADRYTYLPLLSFFVLAGGIVQILVDRFRARSRRLPLAFVATGVLGLIAVLGIASASQMSHWRTSETLWRWQIAKRPHAFGYNFLGAVLMTKDHDDEAIDCFKQALNLRPGFVDATNNLGTAYLKKGLYAEARGAFLQVMQWDPHSVTPYFNLANVLRKEGKPKEAMLLNQRALQEDPKSSPANYELGVCYESLGDTATALDYFHKAIALRPDYMPPYISLSNYYLVNEDFDAAVNLFTQAMRMNPADPEVYYNLGCVYYARGDTIDAAQSFIRSLRVDPEFARSYFNLGVLFGNQRNDEASLEAFRKAAQLGDRNAQRVLEERGFEWE